MVKNLLKINSFRLKEDKDIDNNNEIRIKKAIKNDNERKTREQKSINRRIFSRKGFIDTSVSFDKSHDGRLRDSTRPRKILNLQTERKKFNLNIKNKTNNNHNFKIPDKKEIEENSSNSSNSDINNKKKENKFNKKNNDEIKRKQKDNKYLKLKSKNKKFYIVKNDEDDKDNNIKDNLNIENEKQMFKQKNNKSKQNEKYILKRNKIENINYSVNLNSNNYNTINHEDFSTNKNKIKTLNTQGNFIKKLSIRKKHFYNSLNESKKDMFIKRTINSNLNEKFKSFNHCNNYNSIEDIFYQTSINNNNNKQSFPFYFKEKDKNTIEEINNNDNKNKDEIFIPFDLNTLFIDKVNNIKNILLKEIKLRKLKYKIKKNGYIIYMDENQFEIDINKIKNNIYIIKTVKRQGKYQINNKNIIMNIISKIK